MTDLGPGRHLAAVERMLSSSGLAKIDDEAPLVELLRDLAKQMDEGGGARVMQAYLSAQKDARRVLAAAPGDPGSRSDDDPTEKPADAATGAEDASGEPEESPEVASFARFKRAKGGAAAG